MYNRDKQWRRIASAETFNWIATASLKNLVPAQPMSMVAAKSIIQLLGNKGRRLGALTPRS